MESTWVLQAPLEAVWRALSDLEGWSRWWSVIQKVEVLKPGKADGVEAVYRINRNTELRVCEMRPPEMLECHTQQALARWTLEYEEGHTFIHLSVWGYPDQTRFAQVMSAGARGLAAHLGAQLLEVGSWSAASDPSTLP